MSTRRSVGAGKGEERRSLQTFFRTKKESKRPESQFEERIEKLQRFDRYLKLLKHNSDTWLRKRGKSNFTGFSLPQKHQIKEFFTSLDTDSSGGLSIHELFTPLLALGLVRSKTDVMRIFRRDSEEDVIEFEEFVGILERERVTEEAIAKMVEAFIRPSPLPHQIRISSHRRKLMLQAYTGCSLKKRESGQSFLKLFARELTPSPPPFNKAEVMKKKQLRRLESLRAEPGNLSVYGAEETKRRGSGRASIADSRRRNLSGCL